MKVLFQLGHPAHFHLFKNVIKLLQQDGHQVSILIKKKDILETLLKESKLEYINILPEGRKDGKIGIIIGVIKKNIALLKYCLKQKPDLMVGTAAEIAHIGKILNIPSLNFTEDDAAVIMDYARVVFPFTTNIVSPTICNNGRWEKKSIKYEGYQKLAYLHPNQFTPNIKVVEKYLDPTTKYFIIRLVNLNAHHDENIEGINDKVLQTLIAILEQHGDVYLTSEIGVDKKYEKYLLKIDTLDIHHLLAFSHLYIGDSQSMAVEAAVLGVPSIRLSDFSGKISVLEELEYKYKLTKGFKTNQTQEFFAYVENLLQDQNLKSKFTELKLNMLNDKIDVTEYIHNLIIKFKN